MTFAESFEKYLDTHSTVDKDKTLEKISQQKKVSSPDYIKNLQIDASLDLHGLTRDEAWSRIDIFVEDCSRKGLKKVLIIHGKGNHNSESDCVLKDLVRLYIEKSPKLGTSGHPDNRNGGTGATWVILKNNLNK